MDNFESKQTILDRYIDENRDEAERIKARHRGKIGNSAAMQEELFKVYQPLIDQGFIRHRVNKSNSFRVNGEYIQVAYRIAIRAGDGKWQVIDDGKESIKREFENFVRRMVVAEKIDRIRAYVDALRVPAEEAAYSVPDLTSIWGKR